MEQQIDANLRLLKERIHEAATRSGRGAGAVVLVAICKGQSALTVRAAYKAGQRDFGENRVAEAREKQVELTELSEIRWHMVGHIQGRKAKDVAPHFFMVHSIDRMKIAQRLDRFAADSGRILPVLLECNTSGEASKTGWPAWQKGDWPVTVEDIQMIRDYKNLDVRGLMTMAPWTADRAVLRSTFLGLRTFRDFLEDKLLTDLPELSMGMTDDYEIAIEEGATIVRVGRAIFGPRHTDAR
ncbi:MAG: YggS family pyridoxal phosphate-dependent enzyme [Anaerolineales bacterium]